jgi:hypothetical protein
MRERILPSRLDVVVVRVSSQPMQQALHFLGAAFNFGATRKVRYCLLKRKRTLVVFMMVCSSGWTIEVRFSGKSCSQTYGPPRLLLNVLPSTRIIMPLFYGSFFSFRGFSLLTDQSWYDVTHWLDCTNDALTCAWMGSFGNFNRIRPESWLIIWVLATPAI